MPRSLHDSPPGSLPRSLTRLLHEPAAHSFAPTPGDRIRGEAAPNRHDRERLEAVVLRAVVVSVTALIWVAILWLVLRHLLS